MSLKEIRVLFLRIKARTRLGYSWQITMPYNPCPWKHLVQRTQQEVEGDHLLRRAVVLKDPPSPLFRGVTCRARLYLGKVFEIAS